MNRAIRRAFLRMGAAVCAVTLVIVLLPGVVSQFYYDPGKIVGQDSYGGTTNQMSLDMAVYTELALPGTYRNNVQVEDRGYGNYDISIYQNVMIFPFIRMSAGQGAFRIQRDRSKRGSSGCMTSISSACLCPMPSDGFRWIWTRRKL